MTILRSLQIKLGGEVRPLLGRGLGTFPDRADELMVGEKAPGEDLATAQDRLNRGVSFLDDLSETTRAFWERVTEGLLSLDSRLKRFDDKANYIMVCHPALGFHVTMYEDHALVTMDYWYEGSQADSAMPLIGQVVDTIRELSGWSVWDRHLGREVNSGDEWVIEVTSTDRGDGL